MEQFWTLATLVLVLTGCTATHPPDGEALQSKETELAMKNEKIALLEMMIEKQHTLIENLVQKEKERLIQSANHDPKDDRLEAVKKEFDLLKTNTQNQNELLVHLYNELVTKIGQMQGRTSEVERRLAEMEKK